MRPRPSLGTACGTLLSGASRPLSTSRTIPLSLRPCDINIGTGAGSARARPRSVFVGVVAL
eukprot:7456563-Alexandrium_andersonii.AAC.1